ncbi:MAG: DnaJ domain-containing protein [Candidatus Thiodiazotropha sp. (ex Monitilora ramsayi)]|nr:DnaJ domain-containing protein [Candidatus Thiodiazotropha sp. (ex Monitilora ramsayi)]
MEFKDYYNIIGVQRTATQDEIKRAYRKLARKYHPDVSKVADAEQHFKEVGEAYEVLKDPEKRAAYDQLGMNWKAGQEFRPPPDWDANFEFRGGFANGGDSSFSDFFDSLFGRGFSGSQGAAAGPQFHTQGEDHHAKIMIDLEDAFQGATRSLTLRVPDFDAQGRLITRERILNVRIPKGVKQGQKIRLTGQGSSGLGSGMAGDLYLEVEFRLHPLYSVEGRDLTLNLPVAPWEAALGAKVKTPTPEGNIDLKIPPGSVTGCKLRLKGRGIPGRTSGDLYVNLQITLPPADTDQAKALYRRMESELGFNPRVRLGI